MHHGPYQKKNCHSREGGNPRIYGGERKVQLIMFTYLYLFDSTFSPRDCHIAYIFGQSEPVAGTANGRS